MWEALLKIYTYWEGVPIYVYLLLYVPTEKLASSWLYVTVQSREIFLHITYCDTKFQNRKQYNRSVHLVAGALPINGQSPVPSVIFFSLVFPACYSCRHIYSPNGQCLVIAMTIMIIWQKVLVDVFFYDCGRPIRLIKKVMYNGHNTNHIVKIHLQFHSVI